MADTEQNAATKANRSRGAKGGGDKPLNPDNRPQPPQPQSRYNFIGNQPQPQHQQRQQQQQQQMLAAGTQYLPGTVHASAITQPHQRQPLPQQQASKPRFIQQHRLPQSHQQVPPQQVYPQVQQQQDQQQNLKRQQQQQQQYQPHRSQPQRQPQQYQPSHQRQHLPQSPSTQPQFLHPQYLQQSEPPNQSPLLVQVLQERLLQTEQPFTCADLEATLLKNAAPVPVPSVADLFNQAVYSSMLQSTVPSYPGLPAAPFSPLQNDFLNFSGSNGMQSNTSLLAQPNSSLLAEEFPSCAGHIWSEKVVGLSDTAQASSNWDALEGRSCQLQSNNIWASTGGFASTAVVPSAAQPPRQSSQSSPAFPSRSPPLIHAALPPPNNREPQGDNRRHAAPAQPQPQPQPQPNPKQSDRFGGGNRKNNNTNNNMNRAGGNSGGAGGRGMINNFGDLDAELERFADHHRRKMAEKRRELAIRYKAAAAEAKAVLDDSMCEEGAAMVEASEISAGGSLLSLEPILTIAPDDIADLALNDEHDSDIEIELEDKSLATKSRKRPMPPVPANPPRVMLADAPAAAAEIVKSLRVENRGRIDRPTIDLFLGLYPPAVQEKAHADFVAKLTAITRNVWPSCNLHVFGSSASGMCLRDRSDVDICIELPGVEIAEKPALVTELSKELSKPEYGFTDIVAVATARIPIVKFKSPADGLSCDMGINNMLAVHNSALQKDYASIDPRLPILALVIKYWASRRQINSPAHQTLSSYGYVLMLIHHLQTVQPPILPVLQDVQACAVYVASHLGRPISPEELATFAPRQIAEGKDCTYFTAVSYLKDFGKRNTTPIGGLLQDFFRRYGTSSQFNFKLHCVTIRSAVREMTKQDKGWDSNVDYRNYICIEDPFEPDYNVARVVSRTRMNEMAFELKRAFVWLKHKDIPFDRVVEVYVHAVERPEGDGETPPSDEPSLEGKSVTSNLPPTGSGVCA